MKYTLVLTFSLLFGSMAAQVLSSKRGTDWSLAGNKTQKSIRDYTVINVNEHGLINDGKSDNIASFNAILSSNIGKSIILHFDTGNYLFNNTIKLPSNTILKGLGANKTQLTFDLSGTSNAIEIIGTQQKSDTSSLIAHLSKDSATLTLLNAQDFNAGEWVQLSQNDSDFITSSWSKHKIGQIFQINSREGNQVTIRSVARLSYPINRNPILTKIAPIEHVGIECLSIKRIDNTAPKQNSTIFFNYVVNCWVRGIESTNCTFSHVDIRNSSNVTISNSYIHDAFEHGGGGRAYGVMIQSGSNECLVENNIFKRLRHSMIVQSGANGNVFSFNYSVDPYWESTPSNSAGDMVLHGNYVFLNLFEQNICQNIIIDNSHGPNGPHNTFYRNRSEGFGIFFSAANSPHQNFIGNDIPNKTFPYSIANYTIQGDNHYLYGNNDKGTIKPAGTEKLKDTSLFYSGRPSFLEEKDWISLGTPNTMGTGTNRAEQGYKTNILMENACDSNFINDNTSIIILNSSNSTLGYPSPFHSYINLTNKNSILSIIVRNALGQIIFSQKTFEKNYKINTSNWNPGIYYFSLEDNKNKMYYFKSSKI